MDFLLLLAWLWLLFSQPVIAVLGEEGIIAIRPAGKNTSIDIAFIHSVQRTKVSEHLIVNERLDGFCLNETEYSSFGFGLPFLTSDGSFSITEQGFSLRDMNRPIPHLSLRPGVGTELTLCIDSERYPLYRLVPLGSRVDVKILKGYEVLLY
ncbi:DUF1850 domain-containing protein [Selenomonas sp. TAMA-11512]|uniref:DUF1850 domain-containing protein n=1 Tax=Selenomonas sp. TAMA-11512 TaxID=3095337 RepID=UPI0030D588B7